MTDTTAQHAPAEFRDGSQARLRALFDTLEGRTRDERGSIYNHLLGGLVCYVDDETWGKLVAAAVADAERMHR